MSHALNTEGAAAMAALADHLSRADRAAINGRSILATFRNHVALPALASAVRKEAPAQQAEWLLALALIDALTNHAQTVRDNITAAAADAGRITT
jgi:hypothetical protein